jgi:protein gp37
VCDDGGDVIKLVQLAPLRWKKPRRIFMTDLFADFILDEWIDRVFAVMDICTWCGVRLANMNGGRTR